MMDYLVYPTLDVDEAVGRVREVAGEHVAAWKAKTEKTKGKKKGKGAKLDFCEDLIRWPLFKFGTFDLEMLLTLIPSSPHTISISPRLLYGQRCDKAEREEEMISRHFYSAGTMTVKYL